MGIAVRLIDGIQIIIVPEAVVEAERVEHGRDVVGVGDLEALVELFVRIDEADGSGKDRDAQHRAHDAHRPAAETRAFDENAQNDAQRGQNDDPGKLFPMQIQLIFTRGVHGLADQQDIARHEGVLAALDLEKIDVGKNGRDHAGDGACIKKIPEEKINHGGQHDHREPVEQDQQRLMVERAQRIEEAARLDPDAYERDEARHAKPQKGGHERREQQTPLSAKLGFCNERTHVPQPSNGRPGAQPGGDTLKYISTL